MFQTGKISEEEGTILVEDINSSTSSQTILQSNTPTRKLEESLSEIFHTVDMTNTVDLKIKSEALVALPDSPVPRTLDELVDMLGLESDKLYTAPKLDHQHCTAYAMEDMWPI